MFHTFQREGSGEDDADRLANVWRKKQKHLHAFHRARRGDHLMTQFECDLCVFRKLKRMEPDRKNETHTLLLACIRRVNLDAFWSRASSTVEANASKIEQGLRLSAMVGLDGPYLEPGPLPAHDHCGYETAIQMVLASKAGGKHSSKYTQWDTIRKLRSSYSNQVRAAATANSRTLTVGDDEGKYTRITSDVCGSLWFHRFTQGCKRRMGQDWRPDRAISNELMHQVMAGVDTKILTSITNEMKARWVSAGTYFLICYVVSLRGPEGLLLDLKGLRDHFQEEKDYTTLALLGTVKGEHHERQHLLHAVNKTSSGLNVRMWVRRLLVVRFAEGRTEGPAICDHEGKVLTSFVLNQLFHEVLVDIRQSHSALFLTDVLSDEDVESLYNVFRSFRRGSDSQAISKGVSEIDIEVVNRWLKKEKAGGSRPHHSMKHHYADVNLLLDSFLRYTCAM